MKKVFFLLALFLLIVIFIKETYNEVYHRAPDRTYKTGGGFVNSCNNLNGKSFSTEEINELKGYTDLNAKVPLNTDYITNFFKTAKDSDQLRIFQSAWFRGPNTKYSWICKIKLNPDNLTIVSSPHFDITD